MDYKVDYRRTEEMMESSFGNLADPYNIISLTPEKRKAFAHRPYRELWDVYCQKVFSAEGVAFGCEIQFPLQVKMPDERKVVLSGSTSFVAKEYRKTEVGAYFHDYTEAVSPGYWTCGAGMSQMMVKLHKLWKTPLFLMPRLIMLFKTRSVIEMKVSGVVGRVLSATLDVLGAIWYESLRLVCWIRTRKFKFEVVSSDNDAVLEEVVRLIASDQHQYQEIHDVPWLKWMMTESFDPEGPMELVVVRKNGRLAAFYMTKERFHAQASSRGFKNVRLASIMEWDTIPEEVQNLKWFILRAALSFGKAIDAFELVTVDKALIKGFKMFGARQVGEGNYTISPPIGVKPTYYDEMKNPLNWRLRPAMGDAGLN